MCHSLAMYSRCFVSCFVPDSKLGLQAKWDMLRARTSLSYDLLYCKVVSNVNVGSIVLFTGPVCM